MTWELWDQNALGQDVYQHLGAQVVGDVNPMRLTSPALEALAGSQGESVSVAKGHIIGQLSSVMIWNGDANDRRWLLSA